MKYFLVPNHEEFFMDDSGSCYGTDVLFPIYCYGYSDHIWFLYEERRCRLKILPRNVEVFDTAIAIMAGLMIIPAVFAFSGGDAGYVTGRTGTDVYYNSEGI